MTPCDLFRQIRGRTLWVIGDSMSKDLTKALKCFMLEFFDLHQYHLTNNYTAMHHLNVSDGGSAVAGSEGGGCWGSLGRAWY